MNISFVTVYTDRMGESVEFFQRVLNFEVHRQFSPKPGMEITFLTDQEGAMVEFIQEEGGQTYQGKGISLGFQVEDIEAHLAFLKKEGVQVHEPILVMPNGVKILSAEEINGLTLTFVQARDL